MEEGEFYRIASKKEKKLSREGSHFPIKNQRLQNFVNKMVFLNYCDNKYFQSQCKSCKILAIILSHIFSVNQVIAFVSSKLNAKSQSGE